MGQSNATESYRSYSLIEEQNQVGRISDTEHVGQPNADAPDTVYDFIGRITVSEFWCPFCGGWHGAGAPPRSPGYEPTPAPLIPDVLGRVVRGAVEQEVGPYPSSRARWDETGQINGETAKIRQGDKADVYWGGEGTPDGPGHGHLATWDGLNASYIREPGSLSDTPVDDNRADPYANPSAPQRDGSGRYDFS